MTTLEAFVCEAIANTPKLSRTSCAGRHRAVSKGGATKWTNGGGVYQPECEDCAIGKAHARGETPTHWPNGRPLHLVHLTAAAPPREEPPEPTPAPPPSLGVREAPRGAETATEDQGEEHVHEDSKRWVGATAPSEERSEPGADPQASPETPAAPRRTSARRGRKTAAYPEKSCVRCQETYQPRSGRQKWCSACGALPPKQRNKPPTSERDAKLKVRDAERTGWTDVVFATDAETTAKIGADLARTLRDAEERYGRCEQEREGDRAAIGRAPSSRAETLMDLQLEVRAQLRALSADGTPHGLADVYAAVRMELAAYDAITTRAAMRENVKAELYELASIALHAMSRAEFLEHAAAFYDECNGDLDPLAQGER